MPSSDSWPMSAVPTILPGGVLVRSMTRQHAVALGIAETAHHGRLAVGRHRRRIGPRRHVDRGCFGQRIAAQLDEGHLAVAVARGHAHLAVGRERDVAHQRFRRGERQRLQQSHLLAVDRQDRDRARHAIGDIGELAVLGDRDPGGARAGLDRVEDLLVLEVDHGDAVVGHELGRIGRIELARRGDQRQQFVRRDGDRQRRTDDAARHVVDRADDLHRQHAEIDDGDRVDLRIDDVLGDAVFLRHLVIVRRHGDLRPDRRRDEAERKADARDDGVSHGFPPGLPA